MSPLLSRLLVALAVAAPLVACKVGEETHLTVTIPARLAKETVTCDSPFVTPDLGALKECGEGRGKGHCYDPKKVPIAASELEPCDDGTVCVPDKVLTAGGAPLKSCAFFTDGRPGVCLSVLLAQIDANKSVLQEDVCDPDERCAPCVNPVDGKDTHVCEPTGVHEADCTGGTAEDDAEECCHGMGVCMREDGVPEDQRGKMTPDECPDKKLCAPAAMVDGKPVTCDFLGTPGVCLDVCFSSMLKGMQKMARAGCGPTEVCLPCAIGKGQGVVGCE